MSVSQSGGTENGQCTLGFCGCPEGADHFRDGWLLTAPPRGEGLIKCRQIIDIYDKP